MEHIKKTVKNKRMSYEVICPHCSNEARRILDNGRLYVRCSFCGANTIAKTISAMRKELNEIYDK